MDIKTSPKLLLLASSTPFAHHEKFSNKPAIPVATEHTRCKSTNVEENGKIRRGGDRAFWKPGGIEDFTTELY